MEISFLIEQVNKNTTGIFDRVPKLIILLPGNISDIIGDNKIYLSEFIIAKVKGKIKNLKGHPKITDEILYQLPRNLSKPYKILKDIRQKQKEEYLFINIDPLHQIVIEITRKESGLTEINSIFDTTPQELKRLEGKLPTVFSSGETPFSRIHASL